LHFIKGKFLYMLAYEPNYPQGNFQNTERNVYLYCKDTSDVRNRWIRVSDVVLTNYYLDNNNYQDVDFFTYDPKKHNTSNSKVAFVGNDLKFTVNIHKMTNGSVEIFAQTIYLKLKYQTFSDGNFYTIQNVNTPVSVATKE
jgi:hypothetical protein